MAWAKYFVRTERIDVIVEDFESGETKANKSLGKALYQT